MHPQKLLPLPRKAKHFIGQFMTADDSIKCQCTHSGMTGQVGGFQNPGVCLQAFPYLSSLPPPRYFYSQHFFHDLLLSFLILCSETAWKLAKQATRCQEFLAKKKVETGSKKVQSCLPYYRNTCHFVVTKRITLPLILCYYCWFARDVTAAMLVVKNKSISLLWELNSIFM